MRTKNSTLGIFVLLLIAFISFNSKKAKAECVADFADSLQCHTSAFFTDLSYTTTPGDFIDSWHWDFGDGSGTSTQQNPIYTYATGGDYLVTLIIGSDLGCFDTLTKTLTALFPMDADFYYSTDCLIASFTDSTYVDPNDSIHSWDWDFGDGNTSSLQNPVHTYATGGNYTVTLMTTCDCLGIDIETKEVTVNNPVANFTDSSCCTYDVYFTDLSIANASSITTWLWNFGDGGTSTLQNPIHTYAGAGSYNVCLIVVNDNGCIDSICSAVIVPESTDIATNEVNDAVISIYPNPANNKLNLKSTEVIDQLRILDLNGRTIDMINPENGQNSINTSELDNGIYILEITIGKNIIQKKFIVNHQ